MTPRVLYSYVRCTTESGNIVADLESRIARPGGTAELFSERLVAAEIGELHWRNGKV